MVGVSVLLQLLPPHRSRAYLGWDPVRQLVLLLQGLAVVVLAVVVARILAAALAGSQEMA
jgi:hypothetical protein